MKEIGFLMISLSLLISSCDSISSASKQVANKGGEVVGELSTEFVDGISEGIDGTLKCEIKLSDILKERGVVMGVYSVENGVNGGANNLLTMYLIFEKDISTLMHLKVLNTEGLETGRSSLKIEAKAGEADYFDFTFNRRTSIENRSIILIN